MNNETFEELLGQVQRPARYLGNEWNSVKKDLSNVDVKFALCFPELYEIGMSHLGFKLIYHLLNERKDIACERVFSPGTDLEGLLRKNEIPLFSLESRLPVKDFDIIGFSLAYEMTFTNVLNILDLSDIPMWSYQRGSTGPLIIAGGTAIFNPEPMSEFIDLFIIGEGEEVIFELIDKYKELRRKLNRKELLKALSEIKGIYVPSLYKVRYNRDGTINSFEPIEPTITSVIEKRFIKDLDKSFYPAKQIVPFTKIAHDRISLEIMRGCPNKCRFCQARSVYHYKRERSLEKILELAQEAEYSTGYEEISLLSLSAGDHSQIVDIVSCLVERFKSHGISISLPSLRIDKVLKKIPSLLQEIGTTGFTFAPEAGSGRMRTVINKDISISDLEDMVLELDKGGWKRFKLYFMVGLPGETEQDLIDISNLIYKLKTKRLTASFSSFIPKPHTPFQWERMLSLDDLKNKLNFIKSTIMSKKIKLDLHDPNLSLIEGVLSRGDRRVGKAISCAFKKGAKFDSWSEHFKSETWLDAFKEIELDPYFYIYRKKAYEEILPWDHISTGISKRYLIQESKTAGSLMEGTEKVQRHTVPSDYSD